MNKKIVALLLSSTMLLSMTSCGLNFIGETKDVVNLTDEFMSKIIAGKDVSKFLDDDLPESDVLLTSNQQDTLEAILETAEYEIKKANYERRNGKGSGTVIVDFSYVDAEELFDEDYDFDDFIDTVLDEDDKETEEFEIEIVLEDDEWLISVDSAEEIYDFLYELVDDISGGSSSSSEVPGPIVTDISSEALTAPENMWFTISGHTYRLGVTTVRNVMGDDIGFEYDCDPEYYYSEYSTVDIVLSSTDSSYISLEFFRPGNATTDNYEDAVLGFLYYSPADNGSNAITFCFPASYFHEDDLLPTFGEPDDIDEYQSETSDYYSNCYYYMSEDTYRIITFEYENGEIYNITMYRNDFL